MAAVPQSTNPPPGRIAALDWLRGLVMVLMTSDHVAKVFYADLVVADSIALPAAGEPLPAVPFLHRFLSHLCAPAFVLLAGTSVALSDRRRAGSSAPTSAASGDPRPGGATGHLIARGLLLIALDCTLMTWLWGEGMTVMLQVLWAIGFGLIALAVLRHLPVALLLALGLLLVVGSELFAGVLLYGLDPGAARGGLPAIGTATGLLWTGTIAPPHLLVVYPALPWLGPMLIGYCFGRGLLRGVDPARAIRPWVVACAASFVLLRWLDGYGNFGLHRIDGDWLRWLQVSKYPPSASFFALQLALIGVVLLAMLAWQRAHPRGSGRGGDRAVLAVFGQVPLFFYVLHVPLIELAGVVLDRRWGLAGTWAVVLGVLTVLYPACVWYRSFKSAHPDGWTRLL